MKKFAAKLSHICLMLPLVMITLTFLASLSVGVIGYFNGQSGLQDAVEKELKSLANSRAQLLEMKLNNARADLNSLANSEMGLLLAQASMPKAKDGAIREKGYFTAPATAAERMKLDGSELKTAYSSD